MVDFEARISASLVKLEPLDGPIDINQSSREKVGEIYRRAPDHLAFVCAHCNVEFSLLIQFSAHIQSHLIQIHSDYIEPKVLISMDECDNDFDDGAGVYNDSDWDGDHQMDDNVEKPTVIGLTAPVVSTNADDDGASDASARNDTLPKDVGTQPSNLHKCATCEKEFQNLMLHLRFSKECNPSARTYECYICRTSFKMKSICRRHVTDVHTGAAWQCDYCGERILADVPLHQKKCGPFNPCKCERCPLSFRTEVKLKSHKRKVHGIKSRRNYTCKTCAEVFDDRTARLLHMQNVHSDDTEFKCNRCHSYFEVRTALIKHGIVCAGGNCTCRICGQTFEDRAARTIHLQTHEKKFQCDECGRQFLEKRQLKQHSYTHSVERKYKCDECPKTFKLPAVLAAHKKGTHRGIRAHKCDLCELSFRSVSNIKRHRWSVHRIPSHEKQLTETFICRICNKSFSTSYNLTYHTRRHSGKNLLQCTECGHKCPNQSELDYHMVKHTNRRDFQCDICPKSFKRNNTLMAHKRMHLEDFRFKCKWCDAGFYEKREFKKHTKSAHGKRWDDETATEQTPTGDDIPSVQSAV